MRSLRTSLAVLFIVVTCAVLMGCSASGPMFVPLENTPSDQGIIYVYRPSSFVGAAIRPKVEIDGQFICKLPNGGYCAYSCDPGEVVVSAKTETRRTLTITVKPGEAYYVRMQITMGVVMGRAKLVEVSKPQAVHDIQKCKLVSH